MLRALVAMLIVMVLLLPAAQPAGGQQLTGGLHLGGPMRASLSVGVIGGSRDRDLMGSGAFLLAEPGLEGLRASTGYALALGNMGSLATARATWLRLRDKSGAGYAGLEFQWLPVVATGARLGAFVPTRTTQQRTVMWIGDVSFGL